MRLILFILFVIGVLVLIWVTGVWRTMKTIWLIAHVTPYEQVGTGENPPEILVLGDSTGYGTGASKGRSSVAGLIGSNYPNYAISNNSKNGRTIGEALVEIKTLPAEKKYKLLLLQIGGNDILKKRELDIVRGELAELYSEALQRADTVVMISSGNVGTAAAFTDTKKADIYDRSSRQFKAMFIEVASDAGVTYIDLFEERDDDAFLREPKKYLALDGLHPSDAGYAYWYEKLSPVIKTVLKTD